MTVYLLFTLISRESCLGCDFIIESPTMEEFLKKYDIDFENAKTTYKNGILEITFNRNYIIQFHLKSNYPCFSRANFHNSKHFTSVADSHIPLVLPSTDIRRSMKPL